MRFKDLQEGQHPRGQSGTGPGRVVVWGTVKEAPAGNPFLQPTRGMAYAAR